jgi:voltage-gated potassium channel
MFPAFYLSPIGTTAIVNARSLSDLGGRDRTRAVTKTAGIIALAWILVLSLYYLLPARTHSTDNDAIRLTVGLLLLACFIVWQTARIARSELPELRAAEALGVILPLFLVVFASLYLSFSDASPASFSEGLDHTRALYFTITVFSTVGFGDIVPRTDTTRILVSAQMLLDLVFIGAVVRVLLNAAKTGLARGQSSS